MHSSNSEGTEWDRLYVCICAHVRAHTHIIKEEETRNLRGSMAVGKGENSQRKEQEWRQMVKLLCNFKKKIPDTILLTQRTRGGI